MGRCSFYSLVSIVGAACICGAALASSEWFRWQAPPQCPTRSQVLRRLEDLLPAETMERSRFSNLQGRVRPNGNLWTLTVELVEDGQAYVRRLEAASCEDLSEAAALAIALMLGEPGEANEAEDWAPAPGTLSVAPPAEPQRSASSANDNRVDSNGRWGAAAMALGLMDPGSLPTAAFGFGAELRARHRKLAVGAFGTWLPGATLQVRPEQSVEFGLYTAGLRLCYPAISPLSTCMALEAGQISATRLEGVARAPAVDLWLAPVASLELSAARWGRVILMLQGSIFLPLRRERYVINQQEIVHQSSPVGARLALGLGWLSH